MSDEPTISDALDGILLAAEYCEQRGLANHARDLGRLYQEVALDSPDEEWETIPADVPLEELLDDDTQTRTE